MDKQIKDLKTKVMLAENNTQKKNGELETLRVKIEKRLQDDEKWAIRDRSMFEKQFGRAPSQRQGDDKYMNYLRMYENQREKLEKELQLTERELDKTTQRNLDLENQVFALQKGITTAKPASRNKDDEVSSYLDQALQSKCASLEKENSKLQEALKSMQGDFQGLL